MNNWTWRKLIPGIRFKLSLFTIIFSGIIIYLMSNLFIYQQKKALLESYEKEVKASKNYIASIVLDLEGISRILILIEDFRDRISVNQKILSANKKTYFVEEKSLFGFKVKNDFGIGKIGIGKMTLGKSEVKGKKLDTFFSNYFSEKDIKEIEDKIKLQFQDVEGNPISDKTFNELKKFAKEVVKSENELEKDSEKNDSNQISKDKKKLSSVKSILRKEILKLFQEEQKRRIEELELETSKFRIQSFSLLSFGENLEPVIGFDTNVFEPNSFVNQKKVEDHLETNLDEFLLKLNKNEELDLNNFRFEFDGRNYGTSKSFFYQNHHSVQTAENFLQKEFVIEYKDYFEKEKELRDKFAEISIKIKDRIEKLKEEKTRVSPSRDKEFKNLYKEYKENLQKREKLILDLKKSIKPEENFNYNPSLKFLDAIETLREVALFEFIVLKYKSNPNSYKDYLLNEKFRKIDKQKWKKIRDWIMEASTETFTADLKKTITNGTISHSRSEAEEFMWQLDSSPITSNDGKDLTNLIIKSNKIGFMRTILDMQDGYDRIENEKNWITYVSYAIGLLALIFAIYFSGKIVSKIKKIIFSADLLGQGNLETKFEHGGSDEFGVLTTALNKMTTDLKHRQEMMTEYAAAEDIQKGLLPTSMPTNASDVLEFGNFYKSMSGVGGDYFDFLNLGIDKIAFCIGDVSNHGIGPALVMVSIRSHLQGLIRNGITDLRKILLELNDQVFADTPSHIFVTFFLGIYDKKTSQINYYNCGHSKPLVFRNKTNSIQTFNSGGMPLGAIDNDIFESTIEEETLTLETGDLFFQYTDGVNEAMNDKSELFGFEKIEKVMKLMGKESPSKITKQIALQVEKFSGKKIFCEGPSELNDDIAMIAFKKL